MSLGLGSQVSGSSLSHEGDYEVGEPRKPAWRQNQSGGALSRKLRGLPLILGIRSGDCLSKYYSGSSSPNTCMCELPGSASISIVSVLGCRTKVQPP